MHVLIIPSERYVTSESPLSGIFQYHHAHLLNEYGVKVGVISAGIIPFSKTFSKYPYQNLENDKGIMVLRKYRRSIVPGRYYSKLFWSNILRDYLKLFDEYCEKFGSPDIIHAHNSLFAGVVASKIKQIYSIPYVLTEHSSLYQRGLIPASHLPIARIAIYNADMLTTVSNKLGQVLEEIFSPDVKSYTPIFNVLEREFFEESAIAERSGSGFNFLSIGSLDDNKDHKSLIQAFALAFKGDMSVHLTIGGDGELKESLGKLILQLGLERQVVLCGRLTRNDVRERYRRSDVFVLPSRVETFGVVLIEAASFGLPLVSTYSGGPEDIVNSINGILVKPGEVLLLAKALVEIKETISQYDPIAIREDCLRRFSRQVFFERLNSIYNNVRSN